MSGDVRCDDNAIHGVSILVSEYDGIVDIDVDRLPSEIGQEEKVPRILRWLECNNHTYATPEHY
jgi:hypothetical protein